MSADITVAISNMIYHFVQKHELKIHVSNCNCDVHRQQAAAKIRYFFQLGKPSNICNQSV